MNVLHLIQQDQLRGAEVFAAQLVQELNNASTSSHTLVAIRDGAERAGSVLSLCDVSSLVGRSSGKLGVFSEVRALRQRIEALRPDVLVAHGAGTLKLSVMATLWGARPKIVYRNIGIASFWAGDWKRRSFNKLLLNRIAGVISVSVFTATDFSEHYGFPAAGVAPIPNGVDGASFSRIDRISARADLRTELNLNAGALLAVSVGSLSSEKRPEVLVDSFVDWRSSEKEAHLVLVGAGSMKDELELMARERGVADRVHFLGARDDVPAILLGSDVFLMSSKSEGMPAVLIEAGMANLPTVAYGVGAVGEVVRDGETGYVVEDSNNEKFRARISELFKDSDLRQAMGDRAQHVCQERFDIAAVAKQYQEYFSDLVDSESSMAIDPTVTAR